MFEIISEYQLSLRPRRADLLVLRRTDQGDQPGDQPGDQQGRILRALWPRLAQVTIIEFKSPSRGFRRSDLIRLTSYGFQYHADHMTRRSGRRASTSERRGVTMNRPGSPDNLTLVLVAPCSNSALMAELDNMGWHLHDLGDGYAQVVGTCYTTFVAFTNLVAESEKDDFLRIFSNRDVQTSEARHWLESWITMKEQDVTKREGYDDMLDKLLRSLPPERLAGIPPERRLAGIPPEQRLAGIPPEQRLAGLSPEQALLALPDELLRALSDEFIRSLPESVQHTIRRRLAGSNR